MFFLVFFFYFVGENKSNFFKAADESGKISQTKIFPSETFFRHFSSFESIVEEGKVGSPISQTKI